MNYALGNLDIYYLGGNFYQWIMRQGFECSLTAFYYLNLCITNRCEFNDVLNFKPLKL